MVALGLLAAAPASAELVPQRSLAGVKLGMTQKQVRAVKGEPDAVRRPKHPIIGRVTELRYGRTRVTIARYSGVITVSTTSRGETYRGTGVGSRVRALRKAVKGLSCEPSPVGGVRLCHLGRLEPGRKVTSWHVDQRTQRVERISLGRVID